MISEKPLAAIYCRLSEEDREKSGPESESIQNQKMMLRQFAAEQGWQVFHIYSDEDYTGADRSRPAFNQLLRDAEQRCFDIVLCKSQSRFTRELELVERYLHDLFPQWGIRFVGYADHADTANRGNKKARQINGLVNEWYLEDLSDNIRTVFRAKQQQGKFIGSFAPYGYRKGGEDKNRLVPDERVSDIVRQIFTWAEEGCGAAQIASRLNQRKIPNPSTYKAEVYPAFRRCGSYSSCWSGSTVRGILQNPVYCGDIRQHVREKVNYKTDAVRRVPQAEQIIVSHTHPALVTQEQWNAVQPEKGTAVHRTYRSSGIQERCRCGLCGKKLYVRYSHGFRYFYCKGDPVRIRESQVEDFLREDRPEAHETAAPQTEERQQTLLRKMEQVWKQAADGLLSPQTLEQLCGEWRRDWQQLGQAKERCCEKTDRQLLVFPKDETPRIRFVENDDRDSFSALAEE